MSPKAGKSRDTPKKPRISPLSGPALAKLLESDGWIPGRMATHGRVYTKLVAGRTRVTVIPVRRDILPDGTLAKILGPDQTGLGKDGLRDLLNRQRK